MRDPQYAEQQRKFDAAPEAELTGCEIMDFIEPVNLAEARKKALQWAKENGMYHGNYINIDTGWSEIAVREKEVDGSFRHGGGPEKIQAVVALPSFIRNGIFLETTPAHNIRQKGMKSHIFAAKISIIGKSMVVGFVIKEDANGKRFYDHEMTEIKDLDGLVTHSGAIGLNTEKASQTRQGLVINIVHKHLGVNPLNAELVSRTDHKRPTPEEVQAMSQRIAAERRLEEPKDKEPDKDKEQGR